MLVGAGFTKKEVYTGTHIASKIYGWALLTSTSNKNNGLGKFAMNWVEILGYIASGAVFVTFWMKTLIPLRILAIVGNSLYFYYGINADLFNIVLLHGALLPLNCLRLYQAYNMKQRIHDMAHSDYDVSSLIPFMTKREYPLGRYLFKRGDKALDIYYLVKGKAHIVELDIDLEPGQLIGEIALFTPDKQRTQTIKCTESSEFMVITEEKVLQLYSENPEFGLYLTKMMVSRLLSNSDKHGALQAA